MANEIALLPKSKPPKPGPSKPGVAPIGLLNFAPVCVARLLFSRNNFKQAVPNCRGYQFSSVRSTVETRARALSPGAKSNRSQRKP
jgi:hypothetical protein